MPYDLNLQTKSISDKFHDDFNKFRTSLTYKFKTESGNEYILKFAFSPATSNLYGPVAVVEKSFTQTTRDFFFTIAGHQATSDQELNQIQRLIYSAINEYNEPDCIFNKYDQPRRIKK